MMEGWIELEIGESLGLGLEGYRVRNIIYSGMPNQDTFAITRDEHYTGCENHNQKLVQLYFPIDIKEIEIFDTKLRIYGVSPISISLEKVVEE